jgi:hypothetical protein
MNPRVQVAQGRMDGAMPRNPRHRRQGCGANPHMEMALAGTVIAAMACVLVAFIHDFKRFWLKRRLKPRFHFILHSHFGPHPLQSAA